MAAGFGNAAFPLNPSYEVLTCIARILCVTILVVDASSGGDCDVTRHYPASMEGQWCGTPVEPIGFVAHLIRFDNDHFDALAPLNVERDAGPVAKWKFRGNVPGGAIKADIEIDPSADCSEMLEMFSAGFQRSVGIMSYRGNQLIDGVSVREFFVKPHFSQHTIEVCVDGHWFTSFLLPTVMLIVASRWRLNVFLLLGPLEWIESAHGCP